MELTKTPYTDKQYTTGDDWYKDKAEFKMDFPNLPYVNRCGVFTTESSALIQLIPIVAKQPQLSGGDEKDRIKVVQLLGVLKDVAGEVGKFCYCKKEDFETMKASGVEKVVKPKFALLEKFLGKKDWLLGYVTVADVVLFYYLDLLTAMDSKITEGFTVLMALHNRFASIKEIKDYRASGRLPKSWNGPTACWGAMGSS
jgi:glutathione S-transferase